MPTPLEALDMFRSRLLNDPEAVSVRAELEYGIRKVASMLMRSTEIPNELELRDFIIEQAMHPGLRVSGEKKAAIRRVVERAVR